MVSIYVFVVISAMRNSSLLVIPIINKPPTYCRLSMFYNVHTTCRVWTGKASRVRTADWDGAITGTYNLDLDAHE